MWVWMPQAYSHKLCFLVAIRRVHISKIRQLFPFFPVFKMLRCSDTIYPPPPVTSKLAHWNVPTMFSNHHHHLIPNYLCHSESKPCPLLALAPQVLFLTSPGSNQRALWKYPLLDMSCEWNHRKCDLSCLASFFWPIVPGLLHVSCVSTSFLFMPE